MKIEINSFDNEKGFRIFVKDNNKFLKNDKSKIYPQYFNEEDVLKITPDKPIFSRITTPESIADNIGELAGKK